MHKRFQCHKAQKAAFARGRLRARVAVGRRIRQSSSISLEEESFCRVRKFAPADHRQGSEKAMDCHWRPRPAPFKTLIQQDVT
jgi:hypothetical protein